VVQRQHGGCGESCVFVARPSGRYWYGVAGRPAAERLTADPADAIRCHASVAMGLAATLEEAADIPGVLRSRYAAPVHRLRFRKATGSRRLISVRMISIGQPHVPSH